MTVRWTSRDAARAIAVALLVTATAALTPGLAGSVSGALLTAILCLAATVVALVAEGRKGIARVDASSAADRMAAAAGALALFGAPYLVLSHRFTDAPSGTEFLFLTSSAWGMIAAVAAAGLLWRSGRRRSPLVLLAGAFAALVGSAGILGNWERPSSFSPFVRFVAEETWMLVAGVLFVGGTLLFCAAKRKGAASPFVTASGVAALLAVLAWLLSGDGLSTLPLAGMWQNALTWASVAAFTWFVWTREASASGLVLPAAALFTPPLLLPALSAFEAAAGIPGVTPLVWRGIAGGALLVVAGLTRMLSSDERREGVASRKLLPDGWSRSLAAFGAIVLALAVTALVFPALQATVTGLREGKDMHISWTMLGWESVAVWAAVALAWLVLAASLDSSWPALVAAVAAVPAHWLLDRTPTHVWVRSLSAEIQQDYGTEYANITFAALPSWPARVAVIGAAAGLVVALARLLLTRRNGAGTPDTLEEQQ